MRTTSALAIAPSRSIQSLTSSQALGGFRLNSVTVTLSTSAPVFWRYWGA